MATRGWIGVVFAALLALLSALTTGCGDGSDGVREIELWTISLRPKFTDYIEGQIAAFEAERPGVRVRWVDVPFEAVERKLLAAAAAGRMPDVVNMSDMMFARFAGAGAFRAIDAIETGDGFSIELGVYHAGALAVGRVGGGQLALPWYLTTQTLMVNEALLAEGGLDAATLPTTWEGLMAAAGPFYERTGVYLFTQPIGTDSQLPMMMLAEGLVPFEAGVDGGVVSALSRRDIAEFLRGWVALYRSGGLPREAATRGFDHLIDVYQNERVAAVNTGAQFLARVRGVSPLVYERTVVMPPIVGRLGRAHVAVMLLSVGVQSAYPDDAAALAGFTTSAASQTAMCRLAAIMPSVPSALDDPFFGGPTEAEVSGGVAKLGAARGAVRETLRTAVPFTPGIEAWPEMRRAFNERFKSVLLGDADLDATLAEIDRAWDGIIATMNERRAAAGVAVVDGESIFALLPVVSDGAGAR